MEYNYKLCPKYNYKYIQNRKKKSCFILVNNLKYIPVKYGQYICTIQLLLLETKKGYFSQQNEIHY